MKLSDDTYLERFDNPVHKELFRGSEKEFVSRRTCSLDILPNRSLDDFLEESWNFIVGNP